MPEIVYYTKFLDRGEYVGEEKNGYKETIARYRQRD